MNLSKAIPKIEFPSNNEPVRFPVGEPLVHLNDFFDCDSNYNHWCPGGGAPLPGSSPIIVARKSVFLRLVDAQGLLPHGFKFKVFDAYRTVAVQQALWNHCRKKKRAENPGASEEEIDRLTAFCVSFPSYNILEPSLHNTGGAVDLTITDRDGKELDMGCGFDDFSCRAWTNYFEPDCEGGERNDEVMRNRRLLYNVMTAAGFTNLPSEWWHYDYGDDKWAQLTGCRPIYSGVLDAGIEGTEPYDGASEVRSCESAQRAVLNEPDALEKCRALSARLLFELER